MKVRDYETFITKKYKTWQRKHLEYALRVYDNEHRCRDIGGWIDYCIHNARRSKERYIETVYERVSELSVKQMIDLAIDGVGQWKKQALLALSEDDLNVKDAEYLHDRLCDIAGCHLKWKQHWALIDDYICPECDGFVPYWSDHGIEEMPSFDPYFGADPGGWICDRQKQLLHKD